MKSNLIKLTIATALLLGHADMVSAHARSNQPLGTAVGATDYFQVSCFNDGTGIAQRLEIRVRDKTAGASILSLQVQKGLIARNTTDPKGADASYSPKVSVAGGNGIYNVLINKTRAGARLYDIDYHCMTSRNLHTGTSISHKQNQ